MRCLRLQLVSLAYLLYYAYVLKADRTWTRQEEPQNPRTLSSDVPWVSKRTAKTCHAQSACDKCDAGCPSRDKRGLAIELGLCRKATWWLNNYISDTSDKDVVLDCSFGDCYSYLRDKNCGIPLDPKRDKLKQMNEVLADAQKKYHEVLARRDREVSKLHTSPVYAYHKALVKAQERMKGNRMAALRARSYNNELREYMQSFEYRRVRQEVHRMKFENEDLGKHLKFWEYQNTTLSLAVRTSSRALKDARDALHAEMMQYDADASLVAVVRHSGMTKEDQVKLIADLKEELKLQLETAKTVNAQVRAEAIFIKEARREIDTFLRSILTKVQRGQTTVGCGGTALGTTVADELTS